MVANWSKLLIAVPWPLMVWSTLALRTYLTINPLSFANLTLWVACVPLEIPLAYDMYLFNLWIANHTLIKIFLFVLYQDLCYQSKNRPSNRKCQKSYVMILIWRVMYRRWPQVKSCWAHLTTYKTASQFKSNQFIIIAASG